MKSVFLVVGKCGEYSDWRTWYVAAYPTKEAAEQHAALVNCYTEEKCKGVDWEEREAAAKDNPYDSNCQSDYTGTTYSVEEVKLFVHVDQYQESQPSK